MQPICSTRRGLWTTISWVWHRAKNILLALSVCHSKCLTKGLGDCPRLSACSCLVKILVSKQTTFFNTRHFVSRRYLASKQTTIAWWWFLPWTCSINSCSGVTPFALGAGHPSQLWKCKYVSPCGCIQVCYSWAILLSPHCQGWFLSVTSQGGNQGHPFIRGMSRTTPEH